MSVPFDGTKTGKGVVLQVLHEISVAQACAVVAYEYIIRAPLSSCRYGISDEEASRIVIPSLIELGASDDSAAVVVADTSEPPAAVSFQRSFLEQTLSNEQSAFA